MPTYEFTCPKGHDFDKFFRSMAKAPTVVPCPVCGEPAERQMSAGAGLVFHGTGFYITDYGKDGKKDQKSHVHRDVNAHTDGGGSGEPAASAAPSEPTGSSAGAKDGGGTGSASGGESSASAGKGADAGKKSASDKDSGAAKKHNGASAGTSDKPASSAGPPKAST